MKSKDTCSLEGKFMTNLDSILKSKDITLPAKVHLVKAMVFPVVMWELDYKESWAPKNWCFWTTVLEKTLQSPLESKEIQPVYPKGNKSWIFIGRTDAEAETPIFWPPDVKNILTGKDPDVPKDWRQEEKGTTKWDGWMASLTWWIWVWVSSRSWWLTGKPDTTERLNWTRVPTLCLMTQCMCCSNKDILSITIMFKTKLSSCLLHVHICVHVNRT